MLSFHLVKNYFQFYQSCNVLLKDKIIIPPETEVIAFAKVKRSGLPKRFTGFFTPIGSQS